jgi:hypothetical protein
MSFDLLDRTPEPPLITAEANHQYNFACAEAYVPGSEVIEKYIEILRSPKFQAEVEAETVNIKKESGKFRDRVSRASGVRNLSKLK